MPNYSYNTLSVEGDKDEVARFIATAKSDNTDIDFNNFIKMPEELKNTEQVSYADPDQKKKQEAIYSANREKYGFGSWYDWAIESWGTKWNAGDIELQIIEDGNTAFYTFQTAWDAPLPVIEEMSKRFPNLKFIFSAWEESDEFHYVKHFSAGVETKHEDLEEEEEI